MKYVTKYALAFFMLNLSFLTLYSQVAINENNSDPAPSAMLDISSADKGLLVPRMSEVERDSIENPAQGLMIFNTTDSCFNYYTGLEWYKDCGRDLMSDKTFFDPITFSNSDFDNAEDIEIDDNDNIYITGEFFNSLQLGDSLFSSRGGLDLYLVKYNSNQQLVWALQVGGTSSESAAEIALDDAGNVYLAGEFRDDVIIGSDTLFQVLDRNFFVAKFDPNGQVLWTLQANFDGSVNLEDIALDENGNVFVVGDYNGAVNIANLDFSSFNDDNGFLFKATQSGSWEWGTTIASENSTYANGVAINGNEVIITGEMDFDTVTIGTDTYDTDDDSYIAKFDTSGTYIGSESITSLEGRVDAEAIAVDEAGNMYIGGIARDSVLFDDTTVSFNANNTNSFIAKYDANYNVQWVSVLRGGFSALVALEIDRYGNTFVGGVYRSALSIDNLSIDAANLRDEIFMLKLDENGKGVWLEGGGSNDNNADDVFAIAVDSDNDPWLVGEYAGTISFSDISLTSTGGDDALIVKFNGETGRQFFFDNTLANSQDGDTDDSNELQSLSFDGTSLEISSSNSVDLSSLMTTDTDDQTIDVFNLNNSTLELSLEDDGEATQTLDLSSIDTDNQTIDVFNLNGSTLEISLEDDGEATQTLDLSSIDTDNQTIDVLSLNGSTLEISLEDDGEATQTLDLSSIDTDNQTIDVLSLNGSTLEISLEGDGENTKMLDLSSLVPIGTIQMWATSTPPSGWLICNGQNITESQYPTLYQALGGTNGSINIPNFEGRFPLGAGMSSQSTATNHALSSTGGEETVTLTVSQIPAHNHGAGSLQTEYSYLSDNNTGTERYRDGNDQRLYESTSITGSTGNRGGGQAHENMPPFYTINFIIKAE